MSPIERKILKTALKNYKDLGTNKALTGDQSALLSYLESVDPVYRLTRDMRNKLYAIGLKFGIDGRQEYATQI